MDKNKYIDNVLIKLKRDYSKDETVSGLSKKLSDVEIELGKAKSYIQELEHEKKIKISNEEWFNRFNKLKLKYDKIILGIKSEDIYLKKVAENSKLSSDIKRLRVANNKLINENLLLKNK